MIADVLKVLYYIITKLETRRFLFVANHPLEMKSRVLLGKSNEVLMEGILGIGRNLLNNHCQRLLQ